MPARTLQWGISDADFDTDIMLGTRFLKRWLNVPDNAHPRFYLITTDFIVASASAVLHMFVEPEFTYVANQGVNELGLINEVIILDQSDIQADEQGPNIPTTLGFDNYVWRGAAATAGNQQSTAKSMNQHVYNSMVLKKAAATIVVMEFQYDFWEGEMDWSEEMATQFEDIPQVGFETSGGVEFHQVGDDANFTGTRQIFG